MARPFDPSTVDWSVFDTEEEQSPLPGIMSQAQHEPQSQFASNLQLADQAGLPVDAVATDPASVRNSIEMESIDWSQMSTRAPGTAEYLIDYNNAVVSRNDVPVLENLEKLLRGAASLTPLGQLSNITADATQAFQSVDDVKRTFEGVGESIGVGFEMMRKGTELGLMDAPDWLTGPRRENLMLPANLKEIVEEAQTQQIITEIQALQQRRQDLTPEDLTLVQEGFRSGTESFAMNAPLIPLMLLPGGQSLALAIMGGQVGSQSYADARADGLEPGAAAAYAAIDAGIEIWTERMPIGALAKMLGVDEAADALIETVGGEVTNRFGKEAIKFAISEMGGEQLATLGQSLNAYAFGLDEQLAKAEGVGEIVQIMLDRAAVTAVATAFAGGGQIAVAKGLRAGVEAIANSETKNATQTQKDQMTLDKLNQLATESETRKLSPERFSQFIADNVSEDKNTVYIDSAQLSMYLADKDVRNDAALILLDSKVKEAAAQGVDVAIPTQDFATVVAGTPHFEALRESMTMTEGGVTPFRAVQEREYNNAFLRTMMQDAEANASQYVEAQQIFDSVKAQLVDTGRVTPQEATTMAQIVPAWATSYAVRNGVTVQEVYDKLLPTIQGPATGERARLEAERALLQANESGYQGQDTGEAVEWVNAVEKFGAEGMTTEARMARAQEMGFDTEQVLYHGTDADISAFDPEMTESKIFGNAVYFTDSPNTSNQYATGESANVTPVFLRTGEVTESPIEFRNNPEVRALKRTLETGETIYAIKDPSNIRSINAAFDPDASDSSNLLAQSVDQIETEAFKKWFGDSKVVDDQGRPLVVYHGTDADFTAFEGDEFYLAEDRATAEDFGDRLMRLYASIKNPLEFDYNDGAPMSRKDAISAGYDGFKILNYDVGDEINQNDGVVWSAFHPEQIKSAIGNRGTFDPADPNILNQNARGYYDPQNNIIRLTEASNASTFLHEFAHLMYEMELRAGGTMALEIKQWFKRNAADVAAEANGYLAEQPSPVTPAEFRDALNAAKKADKVNGPSVWVGEESDYATMRTVLMDNGKVGFAIQSDGTLTGVFKHPDSTMKGAINTIVPMAVSMGATKLDAFEGPLTEMYSRFGFKETSRSAWDPEQAPADWDYEARGTPDVVFMAIDEATANELTEQARKNQVQNPIPVRRSVGVLEQPGRKTQRAEREADGSLRGLPRSVGRFVAKHSQKISQVAADYMRKAGLDYNPPNTYASVDIERAARIAEAYEAMKHDPQNPEVKAAYEAMIEETIEQYKAVMAAGLKVEFIDFSKQGDPYKESPRAAVEDIVDNNHMWVFSTRDGFGSNDKFDPVDNPLLRETEFTISGQPALVNDLFRVVHDYFGHAKEGLGFRAAGEENAWRAHSAMYSPLARRAMTSETRGQNSWVNYGPYGETNRTASAEDTHYADQKIGLLPEWVVTEGAGDADVYLQSEDNPAAFGGEITEDDVTSYMDTGTTGTPEKDAAIRRAAHEQFARGFEQYLLEGKAPSVEMRNIFRTIARWMAQIYDGIRNKLNVNLDDQMRQVFDRMVATERQIEAAKARAHFQPMFTDAAMAGMTEEEWQQYQIDKEKVSDKAAETVRDQLVKEITRQTKQWWKEERDGLTDDYVAQLEETRRYSTIDSLRNGKVKLDRASVRATVGEQRTDKRGRVSTVIPHQFKDMHIDGGSGVSLDDAAALYGYSSGQELLDDIISAPPIRNEATRMAEEEMKRRHGDVLNDGTIEQLADDAVQNEERAKLILTEMKALRKGTTAPEIDGPSIKAAAEASIAGMSYRNIHPEKYHRAEIRAAQDAATALANGDRDAAARHKLRQAMNYYLFRAASDAKADVLKIVDWTSRFRKKDVRTAIAKAGNDYLGQMDKILTRFEFRKAATLKSVDTANEALALWMARKVEEEGEGLVLSNAVLDESYVTHWKNVPYSDLQGIRDSLKNMEYVARYANKLQIMGEEIDYDKFVQQWTDNINSNNEAIYKAQRTSSAERRPWIDRAVAHMTKVPWLTRWLDGGNAVGMSQAALMQPLTDALDVKINLFNEHARPVVDAILNRSKADQKRHNTRIFIPEIKDAENDGNLDGHQILAVALNIGNDGNLRKMLLGEGWATEDQPDLISRDNPKLQAVLQHMTKSDWDLVQLIWDRMDELYPMLAETHRRTTGLTPPKVEAVSVQTPYGEYRGGYYPLVYDPARDQRAFTNEQRQQAQVDSLFSTGGSIQSSVNASATNERTRYYAPIKLSLDVVPSHFHETIQFISHHDAVRRINKLIRDPRVRKAITETMGPEEFAQLAPWLNDVAKDGRQAPNKTWVEDAFQHLQFGVTLGVMGFKASTGIIQISGLSNSIAELGFGAMSEGIGRVLGSPKSMKEAAEFATTRSKVLPHRLETMDREMRSAFESLQNKRGIMAGVQEAALKHIALIQYYMVDLPTWHAAYAKELNNTGDEAKAERYADWVIENVQGSGATKDMATLLRSQTKTHRIFTMFMTFFSSLWNMSRDLKRGAMGKQYSATTVAAKLMFLYTIPVLFDMLMRGDLAPDEDEDEDWGDVGLAFARNLALFPTQTVPFLRDVANGLVGEYGYDASPVASVIEDGIMAYPKIAEGVFTDEEITASQAKRATQLTGAALGVPGVNQAWSTGEHLYDVLEGSEEFDWREFLGL